MITLTRGPLRLVLDPSLGGAIRHFTWRDRDVMRPTPAGTSHPIETASFPLVPYCNRIGNGVFAFDGRTVRLSRNWENDAHPLHGQGWLLPWQVLSATTDSAALRFEHEPDEWPWHYLAEQTFVLSDSGARLGLSITNTDTRVMPAGLGFHPAFPAPPDARLHADVIGVWLIDASVLPTEQVPAPQIFDTSGEPPVAAGAGIDHCFTGWNRKAYLTLPSSGMRLALSASEQMRWFHLYIPRGRSFFCAEPVTQMPDPFRQPRLEQTGIVQLAPGETLTVWMAVDVEPLELG